MRIIHRVTENINDDQRRELDSLGIKFVHEGIGPTAGLVVFPIAEDDSSWPTIASFIKQWNSLDIVYTEFNSSELNSAAYLKMSAAWLHGYPKPDSDFGYLEATYDLKDYCESCGAGAKQIAPFRMKGEPKWGKKHIMQLNWVFDEYFVLPSVWEEVYRPLGIGHRSVLGHRTGKELSTVVQLEIKQTAKSTLLLDDTYPTEICKVCNRKKYYPITRGFFPAFAADPSCQIFKTQEVFGSGASAWNAIIVNSEAYRTIEEHKLRGVVFHPLHE